MKHVSKRLLCLILVLPMLLGVIPAVAAAEPVVYEDSFDYAAFGAASLYDATGMWQTEYKTDTTSDYGYRTSSQAQPEDGVLVMNKGDGLRLNWQMLEGFETFDASKTYTITFDVKLKDFGNNTNVTGALHREFYFAPGGYYNMIEMANDATNNIRVGGTYINSADYAVDAVYQYVVTWQPSASQMSAVVKHNGAEIASGYRTQSDFASVNKFTRSFIWRCEDGAIEVDNITFSDGTTTFSEDFEKYVS